MQTWLKKHHTKLFWGILILGFLLRLPLLNGSFWLDEAAQALESTRPFSQQLDIIADFQPPLMHYLVHFASYLSHSEWWLRLWGALIPGLITIWATYKLGVKFFKNNQLTPLIAPLLMAFSSFHIFYSQELRPYSLPAMWATLGTLVSLNITKKSKPKIWLLFTIISVFGLYSSYLYIFIFAAQLLYLAKNKQFKNTFSAGIAACLVFAPWLPMFLKQLAAGQALRLQLPGWENVVSIPQLKSLFLPEAKFIYGVMDISFNPFFVLSGLVLIVATIISFSAFFKKSKKSQDKTITSIIFFYTFPLIAAWIISFLVPVIRPKRLLYLMPYLFLLVSLPLDLPIKILKKNWLAYLALPLIALIIQIISTKQYFTQPVLQREDWRGLKQEIITKFPKDNTLAVFSFNEAFAPWRWYEPKAIGSLATGKLHIQDVNNLVTTLKPINDYRYVLVFDYLRTLTDPDDILIQEIEAFGYEGRGVIDYPGIGFVRIYVRPNEVIGFL